MAQWRCHILAFDAVGVDMFIAFHFVFICRRGNQNNLLFLNSKANLNSTKNSLCTSVGFECGNCRNCQNSTTFKNAKSNSVTLLLTGKTSFKTGIIDKLTQTQDCLCDSSDLEQSHGQSVFFRDDTKKNFESPSSLKVRLVTPIWYSVKDSALITFINFFRTDVKRFQLWHNVSIKLCCCNRWPPVHHLGFTLCRFLSRIC